MSEALTPSAYYRQLREDSKSAVDAEAIVRRAYGRPFDPRDPDDWLSEKFRRVESELGARMCEPAGAD
jgi:hypothetical protein